MAQQFARVIARMLGFAESDRYGAAIRERRSRGGRNLLMAITMIPRCTKGNRNVTVCQERLH